MRSLFFTVALLVSTYSHAIVGPDYLITSVNGDREKFTVSVKTLLEQPSLVSLIITQMRIVLPIESKEGILDLMVEPDPNGVHLWTFGYRKGTFSFIRGSSLPKIPEGKYHLIINGEELGLLQLEGEEVTYEEWFFIPK